MAWQQHILKSRPHLSNLFLYLIDSKFHPSELKKLGVKILKKNNRYIVFGNGLGSFQKPRNNYLYVGNAGTLARMLASRQEKILAIDGDPNPNLALTLGITREDAGHINFIPHTVMKLEEDEAGERVLKMTLSQADLFQQYGSKAPDDIDLIVMGHPADGTAGSG